MAKLFLYYSRTGNGDLVAEAMAKKGFDVRKVIAKKDLPKSFFWGVMIGGMLAGMNHKTNLVDFDPNVDAYEEVVIGMPIWNGKPACPMNTVLSLLNLEGKKIGFVLYSGGGSAPKTAAKLKEKYKAEVVEIQEPKKYPNTIDEKLSVF